MHEQQNMKVVHRGYDAFGRGDIEGLLASLEHDVEWLSSGASELHGNALERPAR